MHIIGYLLSLSSCSISFLMPPRWQVFCSYSKNDAMLIVDEGLQPERFFFSDNGVCPNSRLPVLLYRAALTIPRLFPAGHVKKLFLTNNWGNAWKGGIFTFHHYHSNTHEVMAVLKGGTVLELGGDEGLILSFVQGDVIIIPAGVAHKNLRDENDLTCIGAYPEGKKFDLNYCTPGERPAADRNIRSVPVPTADPIMGTGQGLITWWNGFAANAVP